MALHRPCCTALTPSLLQWHSGIYQHSPWLYEFSLDVCLSEIKKAQACLLKAWLCLSICRRIELCMLHVCIRPSTDPSIHPSVRLYFHPSIRSSIHPASHSSKSLAVLCNWLLAGQLFVDQRAFVIRMYSLPVYGQNALHCVSHGAFGINLGTVKQQDSVRLSLGTGDGGHIWRLALCMTKHHLFPSTVEGSQSW